MLRLKKEDGTRKIAGRYGEIPFTEWYCIDIGIIINGTDIHPSFAYVIQRHLPRLFLKNRLKLQRRTGWK